VNLSSNRLLMLPAVKELILQQKQQ